MSSKMRVGLFILLSALTTRSQIGSDVLKPGKLPPKERLHLYLLMGQSNMAGRGAVGPEDKTPDQRVLLFTQAKEWELAMEPITRGEKKKTPGVGPGLAFGKAMADKSEGAIIGIIPSAVGGTPLKRWERGGDLYSNAVARARSAMRDGTLKGFLWHQGESDSTHEQDAKTYGARLAKMISDIRADLGVTNAPFVVGQIGEFLYDRPGNPTPFAHEVNDALAKIPTEVPFTGCAVSKGLNHKGDILHFDSASQRELGRRYAAQMIRLLDLARYPRVNVAPWYEVDPAWPQRSANAPWGAVASVALDKNENVWIYTRTNPAVQVYSRDGRYLFGWNEPKTNMIPHSLRIDRDQNIWLTDVGLHTVRKYSRDGKILLTLGTDGEFGEDATHFNKPNDTTIAANGDIFVADGYNNSRIVHFDKLGKFVNTWGTIGTAPGQFSVPHSIVCDSKGRLYVADRNNIRIQVFNQKGKLLDVWSNVITPWGLWISPNDEIWACGSSPMPWRFDPKYPNAPLGCPPKDQLFMKLNTSGKLLQLWTVPKCEDGQEKPGECNWLHTMALDAKGNIYCGDIIGKRLQKLVLQN